jgi:gamma-glutamyltranspeptidase / glutathione hydrolase
MGNASFESLVARPRRGASRSAVCAPRGMVAAAQPLAAQAGLEVLKRGGSAVDAAVAANACLGLMEPTGCGLGGDLFALVWDPSSRKLHGLNASGRAPLALTLARVPPGEDGTIPLFSPYSWTVPGCAGGWFELHSRFGRRPMEEVLGAAIAYARDGFPLSPVIAADWEHGASSFAEKPGFAEVYMPGGRAPRVGERFRNPALARTLETLARGGAEAFYRGPIAEAIVRFSERNGGFFASEDFARHACTWDEPISTSYRGCEVWELPPNGQGLAALEMLNVLEGFDLAALGRDSPDFWHVLVEAKKLAFADRARYYADPAFAEVPVSALLSKEYARRRAALLGMDRAALTDEPGDVQLSRGDTTYLAAADESGMMVSLIQSNYTGFGSGYVVPELGFGLQDRGGQFSLDPRHPNRLEPGKRPFHTIMPAFLTRGEEPLLAFGVMGADMQPQGHAQVLVNLLDLGLDLQEAGDAPRFRHTGSSEPTGAAMRAGGELYLEPGVPAAIRSELARRGHRVEVALGVFGGYQAVARDPATGMYAGASESRKDGCAIGY